MKNVKRLSKFLNYRGRLYRRKIKFSSLATLIIFSMLFLIGCSSKSETSSDEITQSSKEQSSQSSQPLSLNVTHVVPEDHASNLALLEFKDSIETRTDGRIEINIFPNGQLYGSDREAVEAVQLNNIEITMVATPTLASFKSEFMVMDLPFIFETREAAHKAMDGELGEQLNALLPEINLVSMGYGENGFRHLVNNIHPIEKPEDLQGLKMRVMENKLYQDTLNLLGANASPLAFGELYSALQQGIFDGMDNPISLIHTMKFYEVQKYLTLSGHVYAPVITVINKSAYDSIPSDLKDIFDEEAKNLHQRQREITFNQDTKKLQDIINEGMEVNELSAEQKAAFVKQLEPIYEQYAEVIGEDLIKLAQSFNN